MILGLDDALVTTGYTVLDDNKTLQGIGHWTIPAKEGALPERLDAFLLHVEELCRKYPIDRIAFEGVQQQYNVETFKKLAILQGVLEYWCEFAEFEYVIMPPPHWRRIISTNHDVKFGKKRADQKRVARELASGMTGKDDVTEDEADSFCLTLATIENREFEDKYGKSAF